MTKTIRIRGESEDCTSEAWIPEREDEGGHSGTGREHWRPPTPFGMSEPSRRRATKDGFRRGSPIHDGARLAQASEPR